MRVSIASSDVFGILEIELRIEIPHLTRDMAIVRRGIELCDLTDAALALDQIPPERFQVASNRRDHSDAGDNYASITHGILGFGFRVSGFVFLVPRYQKPGTRSPEPGTISLA